MRFGDSDTTNQRVLPLSGTSFQVPSFDEIIRQYKSVTPQLKLSGPTSFIPLFSKLIEMEQQKDKKLRKEEYIFLLILTDGDVSSLSKDQDFLIKLSEHNVLVSCVGFGDGPFDSMESMDTMKGRKFDNFCFCVYNEIDQENMGAEIFQEFVPQMTALAQMNNTFHHD